MPAAISDFIPSATRALALATAILVMMAASCFANWSEEEVVSPESTSVQLIPEESHWCLSTDGAGAVHMVWEEWPSGEYDGVYYSRRSPVCGWENESFRVNSGSTHEVVSPALDSDLDGNVFVAWCEHKWTESCYRVYYRRFAIESGWDTSPIVLDSSSTNNCYAVSVAMDDSGNAHVVWTEDVTLYYNRLFYRKHSPAGDWGDRKRLSKNVTFNDHPAIIECNGTLHVVWRQSGQEGNSIRHRSYVPEQGWDENLTRIDLGTMSSDPSIAADSDGNLHVAWTDWLSDAENEIAYRGWTEIQGWDSAVTYVTPNDTCWSERPTVACDDTGNVHVVWQDVRHGLWVLYERVLVPGVGWRGEVRISPPGAGASVPHLRAGPAGDLHLAWEDSRDLCCAVYYRRWETQESSIPGGLDLSNASTDLSASVLPNPSAGSVRIALRPLALLSDVSVDIYDLRGRLVCHLPVCDGLAVWYGLNGNGASVAPGTYFVSVSTPSRAISKKIVLLE